MLEHVDEEYVLKNTKSTVNAYYLALTIYTYDNKYHVSYQNI